MTTEGRASKKVKLFHDLPIRVGWVSLVYRIFSTQKHCFKPNKLGIFEMENEKSAITGEGGGAHWANTGS